MKIYASILVILLFVLQYKFWFDEGGYFHNRELTRKLHEMQLENETLRERNRKLARKIILIKEDLNEIESYARRNLGMIKEGEDFVFIIDKNHKLQKENTESPPARTGEKLPRSLKMPDKKSNNE